MIEQEERERLRQIIIAEMTRVKGDIASLAQQTGPVAPDNAIGRISRMEAITSRQISEAKLRDARSRLVLLGHALSRIDHRDFGLCITCGDPIPSARLELLPEARFCVDCAA